MTFLTFVRNLWNNAFPPQEPPAPPREPELSCFVKGVIQSIETEPENWNASELFSDFFTHRKTGLRLSYWDGLGGKPSTGHIPPLRLTEAEQYALGAALLKHLVVPARQALERAHEAETEKERIKLNPAVQHFSTLGCPPPQ